MSLGTKVFKEVSWLALFKFICQAFSWITTIYVARILLPSDYGLMSMATIFTGYVMMFSELGLGAAIIQKDEITENELSSIFWFAFLLSLLFSIICFLVASPTASLFDEQRIIPITQSVSIIFIFSGLTIVPLNLLKRQMDFKSVGIIEMFSTLISCVFMIVIALLGGGVWTLLGGNIIRVFSSLCLYSYKVNWRPHFHFSLSDTRQLLGFGSSIAISRSFYYGFTHVDVFFVGKYFTTAVLGGYSFALQLVRMPTDKIVTMINQVSFSALSRIKTKNDEFNKLYLSIVKATALIVLPLFMGGFLLGDKLIIVLLDDKWIYITNLFKYLCLIQIVVSINAINNFVHFSKGRPRYGVYYNGSLTVLMAISFYFAVQYGMDAILYPWFTTYLFISFLWIYITIRSINIKLKLYIYSLLPAIVSVAVMIVMITTLEKYILIVEIPLSFRLILEIFFGALAYMGSLYCIDRDILMKLVKTYK